MIGREDAPAHPGRKERPRMTLTREPLIGVLNAGSSSLKFGFYEGETRLLGGEVEGVGISPKARAVGPDGAAIAPPPLGDAPASNSSELLSVIMSWARERLGGRRLPPSAIASCMAACAIRARCGSRPSCWPSSTR